MQRALEPALCPQIHPARGRPAGRHQASMDKGVLTVTVPKAPPTEPKRIKVQVAQALPTAPAHA